MNLLVDLSYIGGFQLAVDVGMVFGRSAYLSVTLTKMNGLARLQFSRLPYTHWSFTFTEVPYPPTLYYLTKCEIAVHVTCSTRRLDNRRASVSNKLRKEEEVINLKINGTFVYKLINVVLNQ